MRVESATARLFMTDRTDGMGGLSKATTRDITNLLSQQASSRLGIEKAALPGAFRPVTAAVTEKTTRDVYEDRQSFRTEAVYETRDTTEERDIYETRDVYEARNVYEMRDVFEARDVTETRSLYETRSIFAEREIRETKVEGDRDLRLYNTLAQAGIDVGADFSVRVGDGPAATFRFATSQRLDVTINGATQRFDFTSANGSMRNAIVGALDSVTGLSASISAEGKLVFITDDAQKLVISEVANGLLDFSGSPLDNLGLTAGTTNSRVIGTEQVVVGTEQVEVGQETVVIGTENVLIGQESILVGSENVLVGQENVRTGSQTVVTGSEQVQVGERSVAAGMERVKVGVAEDEKLSGFRVVGLVREEDRGIGGTTVLDRLRRLHADTSDLDALFSALKVTDEESDPDPTGPFADYRDQGADTPRTRDR